MTTSKFARLPFFYGWVIVAVVFVTMGVGVNAPPFRCCSRRSSTSSAGTAA
jgi:hypothetical protein